MAVAQIAEAQWGVISIGQLRAAGVTAASLKYQATTGRLRRVHQGVYAFGHGRLCREGHWLAAVLACGEGTALSHASAAALWGIRSARTGPVDVTVPGMRRQRRAGVRMHSSRRLGPEHVTIESGIPVTSISRTLLDLAAIVAAGDLESTVGRALQRPDFDTGHIADIVVRGQGHRGAGRLARFMDATPRVTRHEMEQRFLELVRAAGLPEPETNVPMTFGGGERWEIDVLWRRQKVTVELDSWSFHGDRLSFEKDRARAATFTAAGYRHLQFTWLQITRTPEWVIATLRAALTQSG